MNRLIRYSLGALSLLMLAACSDDDDDSVDSSSSTTISSSVSSSSAPVMATYQISVINATAGQPIGPVAAIVSENGISLWEIGQPASVALETLAESGMPGDLLNAYPGAANGTNGMPTAPGMAAMVEITLPAAEANYLSLAAMPVHTNDAFIGLQNLSIGTLEVGMHSKHYAPVYDAGTEANTEWMNSMPGPAVGGTGFEAVRDDLSDQVTRHPGVVGQPEADDSALSEIHRFDANSFIVKVMRTQ